MYSTYLHIQLFKYLINCLIVQSSEYLIVLLFYRFIVLLCICPSIILKPADLCKCTRDLHGNMEFETLAPHILFIFS